jgi:hypothetical protein
MQMKGKARQLVAITLMATALCADRAVSAAPEIRPQVATAAGKLVTRLSVSLRRVVPSARVFESRRDGLAASSVKNRWTSNATVRFGTELSPLTLHLPPPML